jgi:hypothetical protein
MRRREDVNKVVFGNRYSVIGFEVNPKSKIRNPKLISLCDLCAFARNIKISF